MTWHAAAIGLLFHGRISQLLTYLLLFNQLNLAVKLEKESQFSKEAIYTKLLRAKELILYGITLNHAQREKLKVIRNNSTQNIAQGIILGRYMDSEANMQVKKPVEIFLVALAALCLAFSIMVFIGIAIELLPTHGLSLLTTTKILVVAGSLSILPGLILFYISGFPYFSWLAYSKTIQCPQVDNHEN